MGVAHRHPAPLRRLYPRRSHLGTVEIFADWLNRVLQEGIPWQGVGKMMAASKPRENIAAGESHACCGSGVGIVMAGTSEHE